jgi:hypothetical protein
MVTERHGPTLDAVDRIEDPDRIAGIAAAFLADYRIIGEKLGQPRTQKFLDCAVGDGERNPARPSS